ncbi:SAM-dependent methyltransferase [Nocardia sp. XZ_19_385]|uniref:SAM-dependent methyltransferase n=1 Tax=Nocardia sp. XZ_19_385 TaxID=2769488 RepID=UPI0018909522|nr:SAM-dependent methyltransferase [Nocardia sp. XZ_19_385]
MGEVTRGNPFAPGDISATAILAAAGRMAESRRPDPLINDPLAEVFLTAAARRRLAPAVDDDIAHLLGDMFTLRSRFFDEQLLRFAEAGGRQCVILGSGLDSRTHRLDWPSRTTVFEIDRPGMLEFKEAVLAGSPNKPTCRRVVVPTDLTNDWTAPLIRGGFDPGEPTAWLAEGLLLYLTAEQGNQLLTTLTAHSASGSTLLVEHVNHAAQSAQEGRTVAKLVATLGEPWLSQLDEPTRWLARFGWTADTHDIRDLAATHNRPVPPFAGTDPSDDRRVWCLAAEQAAPPAPNAPGSASTATSPLTDPNQRRNILYADDLQVGTTIDLGQYTLTGADISTFAGQWDPQRLHTDCDVGATRPSDEMIASGIHTLAVFQRLAALRAYRDWSIIGCRSIRDIRFTNPIAAGATLRGTLRIAEATYSHPQHALIRLSGTLAHGETTVLTAEFDVYVHRMHASSM